MGDGLAVQPSKVKTIAFDTALEKRAERAVRNVEEVLRGFAERDSNHDVLTALRRFPARPAVYSEWPGWVSEPLREVYVAKGIARPYSHQAAAAEAVRAGNHVVIVTPTSSGKTLCYNLPVLDAILKNEDTRALYLFPTKALAQDQLAELYDLNRSLEGRKSEDSKFEGPQIETPEASSKTFGVFTYDGDTPSDARKAIREKGHIVLTNPDMLHAGILPHHTRWTRLFENLKYIVIDELHTYRGVFGSHFANVLRRLERVARFYGRSPQFVCCSATIANPGELASRLIEGEVEVQAA